MEQIDLSDEALKASVPEFLDFYDKRPIRNNQFGMGINHSWALWYLISNLRPAFVVESGVWRGHSTWIIENACKETQILSFDLDLSNLVYKSEKAQYIERDFTQFDWSKYDTSQGICFFDDHQNALNRIIYANWFGFKNVILEDNYPQDEGDCYSLKKIFAGVGATSLQMSQSSSGSQVRRIKRRVKEKLIWSLGTRQDFLIPPNTWDRENLNRIIDTNCELPPLKLNATSNWGTPYEGKYATRKELLPDLFDPNLDFSFHYITYLRLK